MGVVSALTVVAATGLEARAVRRCAPGATILRTGIGLRRLRAPVPAGPVITCGLAGALLTGVATGTVIVPDRVLRPDGGWITCDPPMVDALVAAARRLGMEPVRGPLATVTALVRGDARGRLARLGCVAADMETGLLETARLAAVRVVLDTPDREISDLWERPAAALLRPALWAEAVWLSREAPRCAAQAGAVLAAAMPMLRAELAQT